MFHNFMVSATHLAIIAGKIVIGLVLALWTIVVVITRAALK